MKHEIQQQHNLRLFITFQAPLVFQRRQASQHIPWIKNKDLFILYDVVDLFWFFEISSFKGVYFLFSCILYLKLGETETNSKNSCDGSLCLTLAAEDLFCFVLRSPGKRKGDLMMFWPVSKRFPKLCKVNYEPSDASYWLQQP